MSMRHAWLFVCALSFVSGIAGAQDTAKAAKSAPSPTEKTEKTEKPGESAEQALDRAGQIRRQSFKKSGEEKRKILEDAITAYGAVVESFAGDDRACAEAAFRIGELQRTLGDSASAAAAFEQAAARGKAAPRFAARAQNEIGHLLRRAGKPNEAIAAYRRILDEFPHEETEGAKALTWIGRIQERSGDGAAARTTWLSIADKTPTQAVSAVRAADLAALSLLKAGNQDDARKLIEGIRKRFADSPYWTADVEEALGRMRSVRQLDGRESGGASDDDEDS
jgi:tetratricopeptide (TPR) repeat protein